MVIDGHKTKDADKEDRKEEPSLKMTADALLINAV